MATSLELSLSQVRQDYACPLLVAYGSVADLTASGSAAIKETVTGNGGCSQDTNRGPCHG